MNTDFRNGLIRLVIFFALFIFIGVSIFIYNLYSDSKADAARLELVHKVQFEGRVINSRIYQYGGRNYGIVCVKLDYSNVKDFYICNDLCFIKIKNNIATIDVGFINPDYGFPNYVVVNMHNSGVEIYKYGVDRTLTSRLALTNFGSTAKDMSFCN